MIQPAAKPDFQQLFECCPGLYLVLLPDSPTFTILAVSDAYLNATMTRRLDIVDKGIFEVFPDNPAIRNATGVRNLRTSLERVMFSKVSDTMALQQYDIRKQASDGGGFEERFWMPTNTPILDDKGQVRYIMHRVEDATAFVHLKQHGVEQEKNTEILKEKLQRMEMKVMAGAKEHENTESNNQLARIILDRMYQFVGLLDAQGRFLEINKPALDGSGLKKSDVLGSFLWGVPAWNVTPENPKKVHQVFLRATKGEFVREELDLLAGAGGREKITIDFSLMPILDKNGEIAFYLGEGRNITEKKQAEAEIASKNLELTHLNAKLKELDQLKTKFFANVSHELRTPLTLILGPAEQIKANAALTQAQKENMDVIIRNGQLLLKYVNELLDVARLESGKIIPSYAEFNLNDMINALAANFSGAAKDKNISFVVDNRQSVSVQMDPNMIQRVLLNLIGNAFKFTPKGGSIQVRVAQNDERVLIIVEDSGPGVAQSLRETIFERFKQGEDPMNKASGGTGLGLAIAREFVALHGGSISIDGTAKGAKFIVSLPFQAPANEKVLTKYADIAWPTLPALYVAESPKPSLATAKMSLKDNAKGLVLVVEDNPDLNRFLVDILSPEFDVAIAFNGQDGIDQALKVKPDLILSDVMMPIMSGDEMVTCIRQIPELDGTPIMLLTAKADDQLRVALLKDGAQDYILKPFFTEEVLARSRNLVMIKKTREQLQLELQSSEKDLQQLTREITQNRRELKEAIITRDEFLSIASHELNTPVSTLKLQLQIIERKIDPKENKTLTPAILKKSLEMSLKQVDIFMNLITKLLDASKIRLGKLDIHVAPFNFSTFLKESYESHQPEFVLAGCKVRLMVEAGLDVEWDKTRWHEILNNLFSNITKYAAGKSAVISARKTAANTVLFTVEDQGRGIPLAMQQKIFERFGRVSTQAYVGGLGLGLFIVKNLVQAHQGTITLDSREGQGTKFTIEIPMRLHVKNEDTISHEQH